MFGYDTFLLRFEVLLLIYLLNSMLFRPGLKNSGLFFRISQTKFREFGTEMIPGETAQNPGIRNAGRDSGTALIGSIRFEKFSYGPFAIST